MLARDDVLAWRANTRLARPSPDQTETESPMPSAGLSRQRTGCRQRRLAALKILFCSQIIVTVTFLRNLEPTASLSKRSLTSKINTTEKLKKDLRACVEDY